ncbi:MAG: VWA domain-containing protein, partial [Azospirillaceae bacterium]
MNVRRALLGCTAALATLTGGIALAQQENVIIVLDASGSMWGQVDGVPKIVIAREVFADLLSDWDTTRNLGVMAYGHRREGDCADIQQIIDVGPVDPNTAINTINSVMPRGRTPLTDAVRLAAEQLRYQDEPATVILLTDGLETCNADPCALATELEAGGVNFTAHVIGFDVAEADRPQLSCIAENTGGMFLPADNAQQLGEAMQTVAVAPPPEPEPVDAEITLSAVDAESRDPVSGVSWRILVSGTEEFVSDSDQDTYTLTLEGGEYIVVADAGEAVGSSTITVEPGVAASHEVPISFPTETASVAAPAEIPAASLFQVTWENPDAADQDYVTIVEAGAPEGTYNDYARVREGNPLEIVAPDALGAFEVRYIDEESRETLGSQAVTLAPISASLDAPAEIAAGSVVRVGWEGPDAPNDYITIVEAGAAEGTYTDYARTRNGSPAEITVPDAIGNYEIRYVVQQSGRTLASLPVTLTAVSASLDAPAEAAAGDTIQVGWEGPDGPNDYITVVEAGAPEGTYTDYARTRNGSPAEITLPDAIGSYEIRYVVQQSGRALASAPITLTAVGATLDALAEIPAGSSF